MQEKILDNTYRLLEEIGRGGFGAVYRAARIGAEGSGQVAIKLLNRNPKLSNDDYIRFQREATLMSQLVHPGIVTVFELSEDAGSYFIAMEFIAGHNLREFVKSRGGKLSLTEVVDILIQAAEALDYVHSHSIIHRDIKPQNMLIEERSERGEHRSHVKLVDFGVARLGEAASVGAYVGESVVGTYAYMAPEATGLTPWEIDARADIYSLGIVAYELVAGKVPFHDLRNDEILKAHVEREPPSIRQVRGQDIHHTIESIIRKCISKNPADRYQSMFGLVCDLKRVQVDLRSRGVVGDFVIGKKDIGIGSLLEEIFVGREAVVQGVLKSIEGHSHSKSAQWGLVKSGVGLGKTRCLQEIRRGLEQKKSRFIYLRFSESEQRLPLQSLSLSLNDFLLQFQRTNKLAFRKYMTKVLAEMGPMAIELGRFIPALRHFAISPQGELQSVNSVSAASQSVTHESEEMRLSSRSLDRRYVAPHQRLNDALISLLSGFLEENERLVILMDDLHLADTSMLSFLTYVLEYATEKSPFSIVFTLREMQSWSNIILENFLNRLHEKNPRLSVWHLESFGRTELSAFFEALGVVRFSEEFVSFVLEKGGGTPLQLSAMVKQMLAQDVLVPAGAVPTAEKKSVQLHVDFMRLQQTAIDFVSIELLLASIDSLDSYDLSILKIAAVSYDACERALFQIDELAILENLDARLMALVNKGYFEILGDDNAPIQRRLFAFTHEKIRNAVLLRIDVDSRRKLHYELVQRIRKIYRTPKKEQVLALAKHCDGSGDSVSAVDSVKYFLRAARVYIQSSEHNQARYYVDKARDVTSKMLSRQEKLQNLRECYEVEYMLQAAQGNLVEASEVCKNLLEITYDEAKRESLQIFWGQLLLGLGRHQAAYIQAREVMKRRSLMSRGTIHELISALNDLLLGKFLYPFFLKLLSFLPSSGQERGTDVIAQSLMVMSLAHLHGGVPKLEETLSVGARLGMFHGPLDKDRAIMRAVLAILYIHRGVVSGSYQMCEESEYFLQIKGFKNQQRWLVGLRSIWIDYPMGRMDRLFSLVDTDAGFILPSSGVMHFESYGLRSWLTLISPSSRAARSASANDAKQRRKSDQRKASERALDSSSEHLGGNNVSRRVLDSGENNQYTALALFSDSIRFALSDKIEPLRRAAEQLRRQSSVSQAGDAFADFAFSFQSLVLGHQHESLKYYRQGMARLGNMKVDVISVVVGDALRFSAMTLPLLAISFRGRGWPWGRALKRELLVVDKVLRRAEGVQNPRRSAMSLLFHSFLVLLHGQKRDAFVLMEKVVVESRSQRTDLVECLALGIMGAFSASSSVLSARSYFLQAREISLKYDLRLLERHIWGLARQVKVELHLDDAEQEEKQLSTHVSREKQSTVGLSEIMMKMQALHATKDTTHLLEESLRILKTFLRAQGGRAYIREIGKARFRFAASHGDEFGSQYNDKWVLKLFPNSAEDPVRVLPMDDSDSEKNHQTQTSLADDTQKISGKAPVTQATAAAFATNEATAAGTAVTGTAESENGELRASAQTGESQYLVLVALVSNKSLIGWVAILGVPVSAYSSREIEQELVLLGLHVGHLLIRMEPALMDADDLSPESVAEESARDIVDGELPRGLMLEVHGRCLWGAESGWRVFVLRGDVVLIVQWKISSKNNSHAQKVGEFIGRHVQFFSHSARQSSEVLSVENVLLKLSSDFTTILENTCSDARLDNLKIAIVVWDQKERKAAEGDFGGESFGFGGNSEVEREYLQEIGGILASDRLVYHERVRRIIGPCGWIFVASERLEAMFTDFSRTGFVERYVRARVEKGSRLVDFMKSATVKAGSFLALFVGEQDEG